MITRQILFLVGVVVVLLVAGCNKNSTNPTGPTTQPSFPSVTLKGPNTNSTEAHAVETKTNISALNTMTSPTYLAALILITPTQNGNVWTWAFTQGTLTLTATATTQTDGSNAWSVKLNGKDPSTDSTYNNWIAVTGTSSADGKSGDFKTYNINSTVLAGEIVWSTDASNKLTATFTAYTNGTASGKSIVTNNADGSGELDSYVGTILVFKSTWVAAGTGTWWTYDATTGNQTGTGTWS